MESHTSLEDGPHLLREIEYFAIYKDLEHKEVTIEGWRDKEAALELIRETYAWFRRRLKTGPKEVPLISGQASPTVNQRQRGSNPDSVWFRVCP